MVLAAVVAASMAGYIFYKYRLRVRLIIISSTNFLHCDHLFHVSNFHLICSLTWTRRLWPSCHSTCQSTISKIRLSIMKLSLFNNVHLCRSRRLLSTLSCHLSSSTLQFSQILDEACIALFSKAAAEATTNSDGQYT